MCVCVCVCVCACERTGLVDSEFSLAGRQVKAEMTLMYYCGPAFESINCSHTLATHSSNWHQQRVWVLLWFLMNLESYRCELKIE